MSPSGRRAAIYPVAEHHGSRVKTGTSSAGRLRPRLLSFIFFVPGMAAGPAEEGDDRFRALDGRLDPNEADAMTPRAGKRLCHSEGPGCFANITRRHDTGVHTMSQGQLPGQISRACEAVRVNY